MNKFIVIGGGVAVVGIAYYLYKKNQASSAQALTPSPAGSGAQLPAATTPTAPAPTARQTIWKDRDGNIFELTSIPQRWGYVIKVNGSVQAKSNQAEVMFLGPDGYMVQADNNGSVLVYKNNGWQYVIRDNKTQAKEYLARFGADTSFLNGFHLGAFLMS